MESFTPLFEDAEEFSSNESGWTKYIVSPAREENLGSAVDNNGGDDDEEDHDASRKIEDYDIDDDDSFASDASSGPGNFAEISEDGYASSYTKHARADGCCQFYSGKKAYHKEVEERSERVANKARRNESIFKGHRATHVFLKQKQGKKNKHGDQK
ncbi:hypothetical protein Ancab_018643 [Ancistrocladus abbreviatus]